MAWDPPIDLDGDLQAVRVSASDVASRSACGRFLALKTRPQIRRVDGWQRLFPPRDADPDVFPLGTVSDLVLEAHRTPGLETYAGQRAWLSRRLDETHVHRLMRQFVEHAVENVLEAHESIEADVGALQLLRRHPAVGPDRRQLWVWAPLYETADGTREIRRLRMGAARDDSEEDSGPWAAAAGFVAAASPGRTTPLRVRVVEIGCVNGSITVLFDDTPEAARERFTRLGRERAATLTEQDHAVPCSSCGDCKGAGSCRALVPLDGLLGQRERGHRSRSVSPTDLQQYATCPAQWLMDRSVHLPKDHGESEATVRGRAVHEWLRVAHKRELACTPADCPPPAAPWGWPRVSSTRSSTRWRTPTSFSMCPTALSPRRTPRSWRWRRTCAGSTMMPR